MKHIHFICDKCRETVGTQLYGTGELMETHLFPVGYQEWCRPCLEKLGIENVYTPNKSEFVTSPLDEDRYGQKERLV